LSTGRSVTATSRLVCTAEANRQLALILLLQYVTQIQTSLNSRDLSHCVSLPLQLRVVANAIKKWGFAGAVFIPIVKSNNLFKKIPHRTRVESFLEGL